MYKKLSPPVRILLTIALTAVIAFVPRGIPMALTALFCVTVFLISGVSFRKIFSAFKPLWLFMLFLAATTAIFSGISQSGIMTARLILAAITVAILTQTTDEAELFRGIYALIPIRDIAFIISLTLRFIPDIKRQWDMIVLAQEARGAVISEMSVKRRLLSRLAGVSLLISSMAKKAELTALSMDSRGFGTGRYTPRKKSRLNTLDFIALILFIIFCIFLGLLEFLH